MLGPRPSRLPERTAYEWRRKLQRGYSYAQACAKDLQEKAKKARSDEQTRKWKELSERMRSGFGVGDAVWLYIPKVQTGLSRKLAHLWHGPFRIAEVTNELMTRETESTLGSTSVDSSLEHCSPRDQSLSWSSTRKTISMRPCYRKTAGKPTTRMTSMKWRRSWTSDGQSAPAHPRGLASISSNGRGMMSLNGYRSLN